MSRHSCREQVGLAGCAREGCGMHARVHGSFSLCGRVPHHSAGPLCLGPPPCQSFASLADCSTLPLPHHTRLGLARFLCPPRPLPLRPGFVGLSSVGLAKSSRFQSPISAGQGWGLRRQGEAGSLPSDACLFPSNLLNRGSPGLPDPGPDGSYCLLPGDGTDEGLGHGLAQGDL